MNVHVQLTLDIDRLPVYAAEGIKMGFVRKDDPGVLWTERELCAAATFAFEQVCMEKQIEWNGGPDASFVERQR